MHREIFDFERFPKGKNFRKEWGNVVRVVIEKWGKYVEEYM